MANFDFDVVVKIMIESSLFFLINLATSIPLICITISKKNTSIICSGLYLIWSNSSAGWLNFKISTDIFSLVK